MSGTQKPSHEEEEFFKKEEATRLHNLAMERARKMQADWIAIAGRELRD